MFAAGSTTRPMAPALPLLRPKYRNYSKVRALRLTIEAACSTSTWMCERLLTKQIPAQPLRIGKRPNMYRRQDGMIPAKGMVLLLT